MSGGCGRVKCEFFACYPAVGGGGKLWAKSLGGITVVLGISDWDLV